MSTPKFEPIRMIDLFLDYLNEDGQCYDFEMFKEIVRTIRIAGYEIIRDQHIQELKSLMTKRERRH